MVHLTVLLLLCVGCLVSMLIFNTVMHHRLQSFAVVRIAIAPSAMSA